MLYVRQRIIFYTPKKNDGLIKTKIKKKQCNSINVSSILYSFDSSVHGW